MEGRARTRTDAWKAAFKGRKEKKKHGGGEDLYVLLRAILAKGALAFYWVQEA